MVQKEALKAASLYIFNIFPDLFKGMQKGIISALGIQRKVIGIHVICHWMIYPTSLYTFVYYLDMGIAGLWLSKICLEWSIVSLYSYIIYIQDWSAIAIEAERVALEKEKQKEEMKEMKSLNDSI